MLQIVDPTNWKCMYMYRPGIVVSGDVKRLCQEGGGFLRAILT